MPKAIFPAQWELYAKQGRRNFAGPARNLQIAEFANVAIFFWDGASTGTKNCMQCLDKLNKQFIAIALRDIMSGEALATIPAFIREHAGPLR